ncbi:MAG: glycoside hydrolase family 99-like domain-containing protein [Anaerolineaceae bacterium]|nr:glycoside hydrolase family 99-like domain-containing protein [Anaerolineaceae bacterium]
MNKLFKLNFIQFLFILMMLIFISVPFSKANVKAQDSSHPVPVLAYYYIWFDSGSWNRAKTDYPLLGRYSSDDEEVMLQHIRWAKAAGIDGFIVSWKSTDLLNRRLEMLATLAEQEDFKLVVIYQGLDFERDPLPISRIANDITYFIEQFAWRPAFSLFSKPVIIWSGTWMFSEEEISQVTNGRRNVLYILASERNINRYSELQSYIDGNAYYWSSVNPETFPGYLEKLTKMSETVHETGGLWIAPAAPGFDARLIGGTTVVERKDGDTFRMQMNTALSSSPDAIGIISWNEFSENSHIEPSEKYNDQYLEVLSQMNQLPPPDIGEFDSSEPASVYPEIIVGSRQIAIAGITVLFLVSMIIIIRRKK